MAKDATRAGDGPIIRNQIKAKLRECHALAGAACLDPDEISDTAALVEECHEQVKAEMAEAEKEAEDTAEHPKRKSKKAETE